MITKNSGEIAQHHLANRFMSNAIQIFSLKNSTKEYDHTKEARRLIFQSSNRGSRTIRSWTESPVVSIDSDQLSIDLL